MDVVYLNDEHWLCLSKELFLYNDKVTPVSCCVFYSFLRLSCTLPQGSASPLAITLLCDDREESLESQKVNLEKIQGSPSRFTLEAMIDRDSFPDRYSIRIGFRSHSLTVSCRDIVDIEQTTFAQSLMTEFHQLLDDWVEQHEGQRPKMLDIGGRARSGYRHSKSFKQCDVTIVDIIGDESVDVVTDVHRMSDDLGFERFDFAICISVFEHLVMPWKAAVEINKVLKPGGLLMIQTHQTVGLHDLPWDYYRFSDQSWKGLFNNRTGFSIEKTLMSSFQHIVPFHYYAVQPGFENAGGFNESAVIVRKIAGTGLEWPVDLREVVETSYPA